jgi:hypothetical protein
MKLPEEGSAGYEADVDHSFVDSALFGGKNVTLTYERRESRYDCKNNRSHHWCSAEGI